MYYLSSLIIGFCSTYSLPKPQTLNLGECERSQILFVLPLKPYTAFNFIIPVIINIMFI